MRKTLHRFLGLESLESRVLLSAAHPKATIAAAAIEPVPTITLAATPPSINENDALTLNGTLTAGLVDAHDLTIQWGDGTFSTLTLAAGQTVFTVPHTYLNNPTGGPTFTINVTVADAAPDTGTASTTVTVLNVAPAVSSVNLNPTTVDENGITTLSGVFTDPGTLDTHTVAITWGDGASQTLTLGPGVLTFSTTHQYLEDDPTGTSSDVYPIGVTITDDAGAAATASTSITVNNVAPDISTLTLSPAVIDENGFTTLSGVFTDPGTLDTHTVVIEWGDGSSGTLSLAAGILTFSANHQYLDDNPTGTPSDQTPITVTVTDDDTGEDISATTVTVNNVPPVITSILSSAPGVGDAMENQLISISGTFTDIGTLDTHTATIDWGDGSTSAATILEVSGSGTFTGTHVYAMGGIYGIHVTLVDDDTGSTSADAVAVISGVGIHNGVLQIIGTDANDKVTVNQQGKGNVKVHASFISDKGGTRTLNFSTVQSIEILLGDGNDQATLAGNIDRTTYIDGGAGNDKLNAGRGPAIITGSEGDDKINGSKGRDILIGGTGVDMIVGSPGDDILIAGRTMFDLNDDAVTLNFADSLLALLAEWNSSRDFATRSANISGTGTGVRLNGDTFLQNGVTVQDASHGDKLVGASGNNWYFDVATAKHKGAVTVGKPANDKGNSDKGKGKPDSQTVSTPASNASAAPNPGDSASPVDLSTLPPSTPVVPVVPPAGHGKSASAPGKNK